MEAILRGTAGLLAGMAEKRAERARAVRRLAISETMVIRLFKFLLHLCGFGAFIWAMFQVHSVAGGLAIMVSCFALSWLVASKPVIDTTPDPGLRRG
jgi:hypothetical protein